MQNQNSNSGSLAPEPILLVAKMCSLFNSGRPVTASFLWTNHYQHVKYILPVFPSPHSMLGEYHLWCTAAADAMPLYLCSCYSCYLEGLSDPSHLCALLTFNNSLGFAQMFSQPKKAFLKHACWDAGFLFCFFPLCHHSSQYNSFLPTMLFFYIIYHQ